MPLQKAKAGQRQCCNNIAITLSITCVITGGVAELICQTLGEPKPSVEWILADGTKVRAPYSSEDRRIIITAEGKLTLRGAETSDTGLYRCIATNYLDADVLSFRVTVLSPDVEEAEVNGVQLSRPLGQNLVLDCGSTGSPEASVQWILPDHSVLDKSYGNRKVYKNGTLWIQGLTGRDRGFYRCLAANHLGLDLLVSQVTVTGDGSERVPVVDNEGSGMGLEVKVDPSLEENEVSLSEIPSSSPSEKNSQESRTITADRPYPRLRSQGRGGSGSRLEQRRRGPVSNRRIWSNRRIFDKTPRKVDPQKFAEFMKKAQGGSSTKTDGVKERVKYQDSDTGLSGDGETGSGEDHYGDQLTTDNPYESRPSITITQNNYYSQTHTMTTEQNSRHDVMATTENSQTTESPDSRQIRFTSNSINTDTITTESYTQSDATPIKSTFTHGSESGSDSQSYAVIPYETISEDTVSPSVSEHSESYALERTTEPLSNRHPVTLRLTVTDTSEETQLRFSGEPPTEPETSTGTVLSFVTDPNVTPMMDGPGPADPIVHTSTDPESQTTFTAVTTTERQQDEITFHTTQRIKSPRLPAGSTIISRQQIHIIPPKKGRGGGRRRTFQGRRRIIKPNRITDIQSFINKLKQPTVKKEGNATVPYTMELTTGRH